MVQRFASFKVARSGGCTRNKRLALSRRLLPDAFQIIRQLCVYMMLSTGLFTRIVSDPVERIMHGAYIPSTTNTPISLQSCSIHTRGWKGALCQHSGALTQRCGIPICSVFEAQTSAGPGYFGRRFRLTTKLVVVETQHSERLQSSQRRRNTA